MSIIDPDNPIVKQILNKLMNDKIIVGCVTCNTFFLNMKWKDYIPLLGGDYQTPTKWYNKVVLHYCQNPTHTILSNRNQQGFNQSFNFSDFLMQQCEDNNLPLTELVKVALEMETKLERMPI
jgi:hypothetical protein